MQTYNGHVRTPTDAIILFEACRIGLLPRVQRRLSEKERQSIKSGSVFVWDEREAGMRRWTDGKSWSASRVSGSFLTYREMEGKRGGSGFDKTANRDGMSNPDGDSDGGGPDGYRYKPDGLMKQSFSITTNTNQHLHLISYFSRSSTSSPNLIQPSNDPQLRHIRPEKGMYPESTVHEQSAIPAVTRGPMHSPGYAQPPHQQPPYTRGPPAQYYPPPQWAPPSPMHTPPPHHTHHQSSQQHPSYYQQPPYVSGQPSHHQHPAHSYGSPSHPHPYDRPPPPPSNSHGPAPHSHHYPAGPPPPASGHAHNYVPPPSSYHGAYTSHRQTSPHYGHPYSYDKRNSPERARLEALEKRSDSHQESKRPLPPPASLHRAEPPASTAQTIPSISAMLNNSEDSRPPMRPSSRSPGGTLRKLQDIPSHKLGFEVNRDVQALRTLDKTTFKGY